MARELLLAQSSDWAFQIYQGTTVEYSSRRFQSHIQRFDLIAKMLDKLADGLALSPEDLELLAEIENRDNVFQEIDYRVYQS
jgi:1,4-alpha-glucan branching enzyme